MPRTLETPVFYISFAKFYTYITSLIPPEARANGFRCFSTVNIRVNPTAEPLNVSRLMPHDTCVRALGAACYSFHKFIIFLIQSRHSITGKNTSLSYDRGTSCYPFSFRHSNQCRNYRSSSQLALKNDPGSSTRTEFNMEQEWLLPFSIHYPPTNQPSSAQLS